MFSAAVVAQSFVPSDIPNLYQWLDASDSSSITSSSSLISQWNDKSGNGYHATQSTDSKKPSISTSPSNGLPSVVFGPDGNSFNEIMHTTAPQWNEFQSTVFIVLNKTATSLRTAPYAVNYFRLKALETGIGILLGGDGTDPQFGDDEDHVFAMAGSSATATGTADSQIEIATNLADGVDGLIQHQANYTDSHSTNGHNGQLNAGTRVVYSDPGTGNRMILTSTETDQNDGQTKEKIGNMGTRWMVGGSGFVGFAGAQSDSTRTNNSTFAMFNGHIMEIINYNRLLSDGERNQVMGHLMGKWRIPQ